MGLERTIVNQVKTQIANVNGSGSYTHDLSGSDQVVIGEAFSPHRLPGAYVYVNGIKTQQTARRTVLTRYDRQMEIQIEAWCAATNSSAGTTILDALDLTDDIMRALETDRTLSNNVRDIEIEASAYDGQELDRPSLGLAVLTLTVLYTETAGD